MLALSKDEDELDDVEDDLSPDNHPEEISAELAGSHEFQEIDGKRDSRQCRCNDAGCLFTSDLSVISYFQQDIHLT